MSIHFKERAILFPKTRDINDINDHILERILGQSRLYLALNKVVNPQHAHRYSTDYLNTIEISGLSYNKLPLKQGVPIMPLN